MSSDAMGPEFLASIQPIVLVGGESRRFGRDKLREPWGDNGQVMVQRPIEALRAVFGHRVLLVGGCDPTIVLLADGVIPDSHPGIGPIGGILSALQVWGGPVFVLAGDMPAFHAGSILGILRVAERHPIAIACWACTDRLHPCAGLYSLRALPLLEEHVRLGRSSLVTAVPLSAIVPVSVPHDAAMNINWPLGHSE